MQQFRNGIDSLFAKLFCETPVASPQFHESLVKSLINAFHLPIKNITSWKKGEIILDSLFHQFTAQYFLSPPFSFSSFLARTVPNASSQRQLILALLYGSYYGDFDLSTFIGTNRWDSLECHLLQLLAEGAKAKHLNHSLQTLSFPQQISLIAYSFKNYREGSFYVLNELEAIFSKKQDVNCQQLLQLLLKLRKNIFDREQFYKLLESFPVLDETALLTIISQLEKHTEQQTQELGILLKKILPKLIETPLLIFKALEEQRKIRGKWDADVALKGLKEATSESAKIAERFSPFLSHPFTDKEVQQFVEIFGITGHCFPLQFRGYVYSEKTLVDKMKILFRLLNNPLAFVPVKAEADRLFKYVDILVDHLEALTRHPERYRNGLEKMTCSIPTYGKELSKQPALSSLLKAIQLTLDVLNRHQKKGLGLRFDQLPIFIFDQSEDPLFSQNARSIQRLNRRYGGAIIHLSNQDILSLAKKLEIESLINTFRTGRLGYGGARNAVFLLTPVLKWAFLQNKKSVQDILDIPQATLMQAFQSEVLGDSSEKLCGQTIFMLDDDLEIAQSNIFSHALLACKFDQKYFYSHGWEYGRETKNIQLPSFQDLLTQPKQIFHSARWGSDLRKSGMSEFLSKPGFCLNIPCGGEEGSSASMGHWESVMLHPSHHLGGTRFPNKQLPSHFFIGLEESMKFHIPYAFGVALVTSLLDPMNRLKRTIFLWNKSDFKGEFSSLGEIFRLIAASEPKQEMQKQFWLNLEKVFFEPNSQEFLKKLLDRLACDPIDQAWKDFEAHELLTVVEKKSLRKIAEVYRDFQKDAQLVWKFLHLVISGKREGEGGAINLLEIIEKSKKRLEKEEGILLDDLQLTRLVYLIFRVVGTGEFNDSIRDVMRVYEG